METVETTTPIPSAKRLESLGHIFDFLFEHKRQQLRVLHPDLDSVQIDRQARDLVFRSCERQE